MASSVALEGDGETVLGSGDKAVVTLAGDISGMAVVVGNYFLCYMNTTYRICQWY